MKTSTKIALLTGTPLAAVAVASVAYAATLNVTSSTLSAGGQTVASCQSTPIAATYGYPANFNDTAAGFTVKSVALSGIDTTGCAGKTIYVTLTDGTTTWQGTPKAVSTAADTIVISGTPLASAVTRINVLVQ